MNSLKVLLFATGTLAFTFLADAKRQHPHSAQEEGFGRVHMEISCSTTVGVDFDGALALLHNFWYARARTRFNEVAKNDPACAMAYWGAAIISSWGVFATRNTR